MVGTSTDDIIEHCERLGVDHARLKAALDTKDQWGKLVHSFEYLTVLGVVESAMARRTNAAVPPARLGIPTESRPK